MSFSPEFNEALHPRDKGKFTNKPQAAGTAVLTAPAQAEDFDRSLPQFQGWPESLAEPKLDFSINDDGTVQTKLKVQGQGELEFFTDSSGRADHEHFQGNFENVDEEVLEQAVEWSYDKHLEVENAAKAEMKAAALAARGRILAGAGMKVPAPTNDELESLIQQTIPLRAHAEQTNELASTALMARGIMAEHPEATHAEILIDETDIGDIVSGVAVLDANRNTVKEYSSGWDIDTEFDEAGPGIDAMINLSANADDSYWSQYTSIDPAASPQDLQRNAYIIDLAAAAAWTPGS